MPTYFNISRTHFQGPLNISISEGTKSYVSGMNPFFRVNSWDRVTARGGAGRRLNEKQP